MFLLHGVIIVILVTGSIGIPDSIKLITPTAVLIRDNVTLQCYYELEGDQLYAVKWYKDEKEFYKYTPMEKPPKKRFPIPGLHVLLSSSNETHVTLSNVTFDNNGLYICEVTSDAPSFYTRLGKAVLRVIDIPMQGPQITGIKSKYRPGQLLKTECITKGSRPAANLTWLINGQPVDPARIRHNKLFQSHSGLSVQSSLRMHITREMVSEGRFSLTCMATIYDIYKQSCERSVEFTRQSHKVGTTTTTSSAPELSNNLYYALPAARHPETTLIFTMEDSENGAQNFTVKFTSSVALIVILMFSLLYI